MPEITQTKCDPEKTRGEKAADPFKQIILAMHLAERALDLVDFVERIAQFCSLHGKIIHQFGLARSVAGIDKHQCGTVIGLPCVWLIILGNNDGNKATSRIVHSESRCCCSKLPSNLPILSRVLKFAVHSFLYPNSSCSRVNSPWQYWVTNSETIFALCIAIAIPLPHNG